MIKMKKAFLAVLLAAALVLGAGGMFAASYFGLLPENGDGSVVRISKEDYEYGQYFIDTYEKLDFLKSYIKDNYYTDYDPEDLEVTTYKGLFAGLDDPYSGYYTKEEYEQLMISATGNYSGVGLTITAGESGYVEVVSPTDNTPAFRAGIKTGDYIWKVDGVEYYAEDLDMCASAMRGEAGTDVSIVVIRNGEPFELTLTREQIISVTVNSEMLEDKIGYVRVSSFEEKTAEDFEAAVKDLIGQGAAGLVIDLRNNGGGLVNICVKMADLLMDKATVVYASDKDGNQTVYSTDNGKIDIPFTVLVNGGSASASEIFACAIQDNCAGSVVGTQTFGKGIIQGIDELTDGSAVKLTILQYFSPSGKTIHKVGVTPDYVVELDDDCYNEAGELINDKQLNKAVEILKEKI